ncbi:ImmA/IrrE family metallo-endopeptidase [Enterococcus dongliensis]|uniref:ImmA/IrrE family metallo-endopeptidase n=1 Tax=Enterococcus dongliensis TaxID=2559925 RepID=UPI00289013FF|nr:ImmA/IrrE family metallo-endopeptidase [Enterococcus dongliensis]MDT2703667.1 hypothetical protein [Enterococcus dongliensis]
MYPSERLMSKYSYLKYQFEPYMPPKLKGLYKDNVVYLNPNLIEDEKETYVVVAEEISHHITSVGDITDYNDPESRKQERKARLVAAEMTISPAALINAYENGAQSKWEVADELGITGKALDEGIQLYKEKYGESFTYENYKFRFGKGDSIEIIKGE